MDKKSIFLEELSLLSKKHKVYIHGCGCCGSPFADDENEEDVFDNLKWDSDKEKYFAD